MDTSKHTCIQMQTYTQVCTTRKVWSCSSLLGSSLSPGHMKQMTGSGDNKEQPDLGCESDTVTWNCATWHRNLISQQPKQFRYDPSELRCQEASQEQRKQPQCIQELRPSILQVEMCSHLSSIKQAHASQHPCLALVL